jgi:hypothetical protein
MMLKLAKLGIAITAVAILIVPAAFAGVPDVSQSYFVPQAGFGATLVEGVAALQSNNAFTNCPNNDATALQSSSRLMVVVRASDGTPIAGIPAADICLKFNGGTPAQGFSGAGDDSIVANSLWNPVFGCPDLTCIQADAPTDANGLTYITLRGSPAVTGYTLSAIPMRDSGRKWGGWAGDIPVMVLGFKLDGYLTTAEGEAHGASNYNAHLKSFDVQGSATTTLNAGERVNDVDVYPVITALTAPYNYMLDFQGFGSIGLEDVFDVLGHLGHRCNAPTSP